HERLELLALRQEVDRQLPLPGRLLVVVFCRLAARGQYLLQHYAERLRLLLRHRPRDEEVVGLHDGRLVDLDLLEVLRRGRLRLRDLLLLLVLSRRRAERAERERDRDGGEEASDAEQHGGVSGVRRGVAGK